MAFDDRKNFAYSTVSTPPSPAATGASLVVGVGDGVLFATPPFNAIVWPQNTNPSAFNAEIVRVTAINTDTLTITRHQEGTTAKSIAAGWQVMGGLTDKTLDDIEAAFANYVPTTTTINGHPLSSNVSVTKSDVGLGSADNTSDATKLAATLAAVYPVGSIYISTVSTSPATLFGFGTWGAFAAGRTLIGVGTSDQAFAAGVTGGESTHLLTTGEMPSHTHDTGLKGDGGTSTNAHEKFDSLANNASSRITASAGGGAAHNNLQPYIVTYMWQRMA